MKRKALSLGYTRALTKFNIVSNVINHLAFAEPRQNRISLFNKAIGYYKDINEYIFEPDKMVHIDLNDDSDILAGRYFKRIEKSATNSKSRLVEAEDDDFLNSNVLAVGGVDFDSPRYLSAIIKSTKCMMSKSDSNHDSDNEVLAILPEVSRFERYKAAEELNKNPKYFPSYIKDRVKKFMLPKFIDDGKESKFNTLSLFSFSIGGREITMMENALESILLEDLSLSQGDIDAIFSRIRAVCLGCAPSLGMIRPGGFHKFIVFSLNDRGVLLPDDLLDEYLVRNSTLKSQIFVESYHSGFPDTIKYLVLCGNGLEKVNSEHDMSDHTLGNYLACVDSFPEDIKTEMGNFLSHEETTLTGDFNFHPND